MRGGVRWQLTLALLLAALPARAKSGFQEPSCRDLQQQSDGHCCPRGTSWDAARLGCFPDRGGVLPEPGGAHRVTVNLIFDGLADDQPRPEAELTFDGTQQRRVRGPNDNFDVQLDDSVPAGMPPRKLHRVQVRADGFAWSDLNFESEPDEGINITTHLERVPNVTVSIDGAPPHKKWVISIARRGGAEIDRCVATSTAIQGGGTRATCRLSVTDGHDVVLEGHGFTDFRRPYEEIGNEIALRFTRETFRTGLLVAGVGLLAPLATGFGSGACADETCRSGLLWVTVLLAAAELAIGGYGFTRWVRTEGRVE